MKIIRSDRDGNVVTLEIEEGQERFQEATDLAFKELVKDVALPGFRKGKVTRALYERNFGRERLRKAALMEAVQRAYEEAIEELKLKAIDYPENLEVKHDQEADPVWFKCTVVVEPEVTLGSYKELKAKRGSDMVEESEIDDLIKRVRTERAQYEITERPAQFGDFLSVAMTATAKGEETPVFQNDYAMVWLGKGTHGEQFDKEMVGLSVGEEKTFTVNFPETETNATFAGKNVTFKVKADEVRGEILPELTDEFVKSLNGSDTVETFMQSVRSDFERRKKETVDDKLASDLIKQVIDGAKIDIPEVMIQRQMEGLKEGLLGRLKKAKADLPAYLRIMGKTEEGYEAELRSDAIDAIKVIYILDKISELEDIRVEEPDFEKFGNGVARDLIAAGKTGLKGQQANHDFAIRVRNRKTIQFLIDSSIQG